MKKAEFVKMFTERRHKVYREQEAAGKMRVSEAVMGLAEAPAEAARLWRKHRRAWAPLTVEEAKKQLGWEDGK